LQYPPPIGEGGIGIVRLSGKDALLIAQRLFPNNFEVLYSEFNSAQLILSILTCNIDK
jgi:tRNA U34 5-carboxymethylaminomethyl modifying GTPase MnmE/TrmE